MRILSITNMYPTAANPAVGTFVEQQIKGLREIGLPVEVLHLDRLREGKAAYHDLGRRARKQAAAVRADLVHVMYGGVMADRVTRGVSDRPVVVSFCGSDLLGELLSGLFRRL